MALRDASASKKPFKCLSIIIEFSETLQLWTDVTGGEESNLRGNLIFTQNFQKISKHIFGTHCGNFWTTISENVQNTSLEQDLTFTEYPKDWKTLVPLLLFRLIQTASSCQKLSKCLSNVLWKFILLYFCNDF